VERGVDAWIPGRLTVDKACERRSPLRTSRRVPAPRTGQGSPTRPLAYSSGPCCRFRISKRRTVLGTKCRGVPVTAAPRPARHPVPEREPVGLEGYAVPAGDDPGPLLRIRHLATDQAVGVCVERQRPTVPAPRPCGVHRPNSRWLASRPSPRWGAAARGSVRSTTRCPDGLPAMGAGIALRFPPPSWATPLSGRADCL
jgi:hypothetical protein